MQKKDLIRDRVCQRELVNKVQKVFKNKTDGVRIYSTAT